jgi:hypothetical protein
MPKQLTFAPRDTSLGYVAAYHKDADSSLRLFFTDLNPNFTVRFFGESHDEIRLELEDRLNETELRSSLAILIRIEAAFRIDYEQRAAKRKRKRDAVSKAFRALYKKYGERVGLEEHIFTTWREANPGKGALISELKGAFKFRHWLAHGSFWEPKLGRKYDYVDLYTLGANALENFPLLSRS